MMRFHAFQSIPEESTASYVMSKKDETRLLRQADWIGLEKIHGANFSVYHQPSSGETRFAKRTAFLDDDDFFYDWETIRDELRDQVALVAAHVITAPSSKCVCHRVW